MCTVMLFSVSEYFICSIWIIIIGNFYNKDGTYYQNQYYYAITSHFQCHIHFLTPDYDCTPVKKCFLCLQQVIFVYEKKGGLHYEIFVNGEKRLFTRVNFYDYEKSLFTNDSATERHTKTPFHMGSIGHIGFSFLIPHSSLQIFSAITYHWRHSACTEV